MRVFAAGANVFWQADSNRSSGMAADNLRGLRIGLGHDTHRLAVGGELLIGGVVVEQGRHLVGHSDADVLLHAVTDALLGAACRGDIGSWFPNSAEENRNRSSTNMLSQVWKSLSADGWRIINLDSVVFAQQPKLLPFAAEIRGGIASVLGIEIDQVGLKAKTGEHVGPIGRGEAISAECVALLEKVT